MNTSGDWRSKVDQKLLQLFEVEYIDGRKEKIEPMYSELISFITSLVEEEVLSARKKWEEEQDESLRLVLNDVKRAYNLLRGMGNT